LITILHKNGPNILLIFSIVVYTLNAHLCFQTSVAMELYHQHTCGNNKHQISTLKVKKYIILETTLQLNARLPEARYCKCQGQRWTWFWIEIWPPFSFRV